MFDCTRKRNKILSYHLMEIFNIRLTLEFPVLPSISLCLSDKIDED